MREFVKFKFAYRKKEMKNNKKLAMDFTVIKGIKPKPALVEGPELHPVIRSFPQRTSFLYCFHFREDIEDWAQLL